MRALNFSKEDILGLYEDPMKQEISDVLMLVLAILGFDLHGAGEDKVKMLQDIEPSQVHEKLLAFKIKDYNPDMIECIRECV